MRKAIGTAALLAVAVPLAIAQTGQENVRLDNGGNARVQASTFRSVARVDSRYADARHCLDFSTNLQVIICAEKYLPMHAASR